jgi:hypothetical protein
MRQYLFSQRENGALDTIDKIHEPSFRDHAIRQISVAQVQSGDVMGGLTTVTSITEPEVQDYALRDITGMQAMARGFPSG